MASWAVVSTMKATEEKVLAFAAHHLSLGADHLWLFFDDPAQPIPEPLTNHPRVTVTLCDDAHWINACNKRPPQHQNRHAGHRPELELVLCNSGLLRQKGAAAQHRKLRGSGGGGVVRSLVF